MQVRLAEKEYFRVFAYKELLGEDSPCRMHIIAGRQKLDYQKDIADASRVHKRAANLVFGAVPDRNQVYFRPLEIGAGEDRELVFRIKAGGGPFFAEIGTYGISGNPPRAVILMNHTETVFRLAGREEHFYELSIERNGQALDSFWEGKPLEYGDVRELEKLLREAENAKGEREAQVKSHLESVKREERELHSQILRLQEELEKIGTQKQECQREKTEHEAQIVERRRMSERIGSLFSTRRKRVEDIRADLELTPKERQGRIESYEKHIEFLANIERYYRGQKQDMEFSGLLEEVKQNLEELDAWYGNLEERAFRAEHEG